MSQQSISDKSLVIRNETQEYANTRGRVADVIDDLNLTKANKEDVDAAVQLIVDELGVTEVEIYAYIDARNASQNIEIEKKIDKPLGNTGAVAYTLLNNEGVISWQAIVMNPGWLPQFSNNSFINSSIYQHPNSNIGIGTTSPNSKLHVNGTIQGEALFLPPNSNPATAHRLRSDGDDLYYANGNSVEKKITGGGISTVTTDSSLKGNGSESDPLGLSDAKNDEIAGKTTMTAVQTWVNQHYLQADSAVYAGFVAGNRERPYIRHSDMTVVELATSSTKQDKSMFSALVDKMVHYYDLATQKMLSTGVEFISDGILKLKSIILTTNSGTALPNELGFDGTNVVFGASKKKLAFKDEIFEHNVRGKRVELSGTGGSNLNIDLSLGNLFAITNTGTGDVPITLTNMIAADETTVFNMIVTGNLLTLPVGWIGDSYNDLPDVTKKRKYIVTIEKGGSSPIISYNLINI